MAKKKVASKKTAKKSTTKKTTKKKSSSRSTKSEASSPFLKALKKTGGSKGLKKFSTAKKGGNFDVPDIKSGTYTTRWTARSGVATSGDPYVSMNWVITSGKYKGEGHSKYFGLGGEYGLENIGRLSSMIQSILDEEVADVDDYDQIKDFLDRINDEKPVTETRIERKIKDKKVYLNVYVNGPVEDEDSEEEDDEESEDDEEEEDEDSDESEDDEDEDDEEEEEESEDDEDEESDDEEDEEEESDEEDEEEEELEPPSKGDEYEYKPPRSKRTYAVTVTRVNKGKETCALEETDGDQTWKDVPWDKLIEA